MLMSELRWGVKPPFKGLKLKPTVQSEPRKDADEILFENPPSFDTPVPVFVA